MRLPSPACVLSRGGTGQAEPAGVSAFTILVVIGCNVTSVGDFSGISLERSDVHGGIAVGVAE